MKTTGKRLIHPLTPVFGSALLIADKILRNMKTRAQEAAATFVGVKSNVFDAER